MRNPCGIYAESMRTFSEESMRNLCGIPYSMQISRRFHKKFRQISRRFNAKFLAWYFLRNLCGVHADFHGKNYAEFLQNSVQHNTLQNTLRNLWETPCGLSWRNLCGISGEFHTACRIHIDFMKISRRFHGDSMHNFMQNTLRKLCGIHACGIYAESMGTFSKESMRNLCGIPYSMQISRRFHKKFRQISRRFNAKFPCRILFEESMRSPWAICADSMRTFMEKTMRNFHRIPYSMQISWIFHAEFRLDELEGPGDVFWRSPSWSKLGHVTFNRPPKRNCRQYEATRKHETIVFFFFGFSEENLFYASLPYLLLFRVWHTQGDAHS